MQVNITGVFSDASAANFAAGKLEELKKEGVALAVDLEQYNPESLTGLRNLLGHNTPTQLLDVSPVNSYCGFYEQEITGVQRQTLVVRVYCKDALSSMITKELADFGAEKITITPMS